MFYHRPLVFTAVLLVVLTSSACSSKSPTATEVSRLTGLVVEREEVEKAEARKQSRNTRIFGSVSSGGGVSIGLGFLLPLLSSDDDSQSLVRYKIRLQQGDEQVIYHPDSRYAVGDCIDIVELEDSNKPPRLELSTSSCN